MKYFKVFLGGFWDVSDSSRYNFYQLKHGLFLFLAFLIFLLSAARGWAPSVPDQDRVVRTKLINLIWSVKTSSSTTHGETREHPSDKISDAGQASSVKIRTPTPGVWWGVRDSTGLSSKYLLVLTPHSLTPSQWLMTWYLYFTSEDDRRTMQSEGSVSPPVLIEFHYTGFVVVVTAVWSNTRS